MAARGHRIVDLGRTLSSFIEFRVLAEHQRSVKAECLIIDEQQVLERRNPDNLESRYSPSNPPLARAKRRQFDDWWDAAEPASALRSLHFG